VDNKLLPDEVFASGFDCGADITLQMLTYAERGYSDNMKILPGYLPRPEVLPLDCSGRADWLAGFASGIQGILSTWEMLADLEDR
jgi:hypothetical protein